MTDIATQGSFDELMPTDAATLKKICVDANFADPNFILDVFLVVRNQGRPSFLPDEDMMEDIARTDPNFWDLKGDIARRKAYLDDLSKSRYMAALVALNDAFKAVNVFIDQLKKARIAQALVRNRKTPIDYDTGSAASYATDAELDQVGEENESYNAAMSFDQIMAMNTTVAEVCEDDGASSFLAGQQQAAGGRSSGGCGPKSSWTTYSTSPGQTIANSVASIGVNLPNNYPALFDCYTKVLDDLQINKLKDQDVEHEAKRKRSDQMENLDKLHTLDPMDVASETFDKRVADKSLNVMFDREETQGTSHVFILLDVSGSMDTCDLGGRVSRAFAANVMTLALLNLAFKESYKVWVLPFEGTVGRIQSADNRNEALDAMKWLGTLNYDGGGTDIQGAVLRAYSLLQSDPLYAKADICLITDGSSSISSRLVSEKPPKCLLRTILLNDGLSKAEENTRRLLDASDTHNLVTWDNNTNTFAIGDVFKGITDPNSSLGKPT